jgi:hypothetical protein
MRRTHHLGKLQVAENGINCLRSHQTYVLVTAISIVSTKTRRRARLVDRLTALALLLDCVNAP